MALQDISRRAGPFSWASNRTYSFGFKVFATNQVAVTVLRGDVESVLSSSQYTVTLNANQENQPGGQVVLASGVATADRVVITSAVPYTQEMVLTNQGGFYPDILNENDDRIVAQIQQLREGLDRAIKVGPTSSMSAEQYKADIEETVTSAEAAASAAQAAAESAEAAAEHAAADAAAAKADADDAYADVTTAIASIPGQVSSAVAAQDIPGQVSTAVASQNIPGQVATAVANQDIPGQVQDAVDAEDVAGKVATAVAAQDIPGQVATAVTAQNIPGQVSTAVAAQDIPGQVADAVEDEDIPGQVASAVTAQDIPQQVEDEVTRQNTEQLRQTVGTLVGEALDDGLIDALGYTPADQTDLTAEVTARQNADAALQTAVDGKVSKSGDTMAGSIKTAVSEFIQRSVDNLYTRFCGGTAYDKGASLTLFGKDHASQAGQVVQRAYDGTDSAVSQITPSGQFNFQNLPIENRSCYVGQSGNGVTAPWFKVGSFSTTTESSTTVVCLFDIQSTLAGDDRHGLLYIKMRLLTNRAVDSVNTTLEWVDAVNINPDDFVLVFNSDSTTSYFDLYVRCLKSDLKYTFKILSEKSLLSSSTTSQSRTFALANNVSNGSLASLPAGTQIKSKFKSKAKCGKRIVFTADKKFPDYDVLLTRMVQGGGVPAYIYPQAPAVFSKDGKNYLFVLQTPGGTTGTITSVTYAVTVYDLDTYDYLGCFLLPNSSLCQGIVVRTESAGDFIYAKNSSNELVKSQFSISNLTGALDTSNINSEIARVTLTPQVVKNSSNESIKYVSFLSRLNGKWLIDNVSARVSGDSQNAMLFLNDTFDVVGVFDIQKFEKDIFTGYENSDSGSWTIPKTQGISIGVDGVYLFKGGGTSAADTATALTDCGVDHYSFNGDLVRTSVCDHTLFAGRMLSLLGLTSSINHSESEGGFCTEDGRCFWFGVFAAHTGKIALLEEFSDAPDAVDFSDCMAVRRTNIPCRSNVPTFPKANGVRNPWTGEELTSLTAFVEMCAKYGIDDISLSCFGMTWQPKILNTTVWGSTSFVINLLRMHNNRYFAEIKGYSSYLKLFSIGLTNGAVSECVEVTQPSFVVESGTNYKRYSDGTQECWGGGTTSSTPTAVDFPKPFSEAPTVVISGQSGSVDMQMRLYKAAAVSASGFTPVATNVAATSYSATTYRYFARGKWSA